jgi:Ca-activated chloride channel family protein
VAGAVAAARSIVARRADSARPRHQEPRTHEEEPARPARRSRRGRGADRRHLGRRGDGGDAGSTNAGGPAPQTAPAGAIRVTFAYSPEKEELLKPLIASFNASEPKEGGEPVFVTGENMASGDAQLKIAKQTYKPTAWSPSSSMWGRLLNFEADRPYVADENASIVRTPLVIAMWEPMAKVLGYPRRKLGFKDILKLARSDKGWAAYGRPEFGDFKLVHTNPDFSTSGLSAVVAAD